MIFSLQVDVRKAKSGVQVELFMEKVKKKHKRGLILIEKKHIEMEIPRLNANMSY